MDIPNSAESYCTICGIDFDDAGLERICEHQNLHVPVCAPCFDDISKNVRKAQYVNDYCAWCGEGGDLLLCDNCEFAFCDSCIETNFPAGSLEAVKDSAIWKCPSCDPSPIAHLGEVLMRYKYSSWFPETLESTIALLCLVEDQLLLCEQMNEPETWKLEEDRIRANLECGDSEDAISDDIALLKSRWKQNGVRMEHRKCELQDHLEQQGGNLCSFYRYRDRLMASRSADSAHSDTSQGESVQDPDKNEESEVEGFGASGWYIKDLLNCRDDMPTLTLASCQSNVDASLVGSSSGDSGYESSSSSEREPDKEDFRKTDGELKQMSEKAAQDPRIANYIENISSILPHTYPRQFLQILPRNILTALVKVKYGSEDHAHIIQTYSVPFPVEIVMKYTSLSFDNEWKKVQWPSLVGFVHPSVIRALYNGSEYEIGGLAGHFGVPQSVDSLEDTGDIDQLRGLNEEYVASRGPKSASATMGFGVVEEEDDTRRMIYGKRRLPEVQRCDDCEDERVTKMQSTRRERGSLGVSESRRQSNSAEKRKRLAPREKRDSGRDLEETLVVTSHSNESSSDSNDSPTVHKNKKLRTVESSLRLPNKVTDAPGTLDKGFGNGHGVVTSAKSSRPSGNFEDPILLDSDDDDDDDGNGQEHSDVVLDGIGDNESGEGTLIAPLDSTSSISRHTTGTCGTSDNPSRRRELKGGNSTTKSSLEWNEIFSRPSSFTPTVDKARSTHIKSSSTSSANTGTSSSSKEKMDFIHDLELQEEEGIATGSVGLLRSNASLTVPLETARGDFAINEKSEISKLNRAILMDIKMSDRLMEHQKEAVRFIWKNTMAGVISNHERLVKEKEKREKAVADGDVCLDGSYDDMEDYSQESTGHHHSNIVTRASSSAASGSAESLADQKDFTTGDIRDMLSKQGRSGSSAISKSKARRQKDIEKANTGNGCVVAHCMGSGKSLTTVSFVTTLLTDPYLKRIRNPLNDSLPLIHRVLIIAPVNVISNWSLEFGKWTPPRLLRQFNRYSIDSSKKVSDRYSELMQWYNKGGVLITGKELFCQLITTAEKDIVNEAEMLAAGGSSSDAAASPLCAATASSEKESGSTSRHSSLSGLAGLLAAASSPGAKQAGIVKRAKLARNVKKYLLDPGPDFVILDEAHYLKQVSSNMFTIINSIRTKRRVALTGSPMQNNLQELWSMIEFVKSGHLNSFKTFEKRFKLPIEAGGLKDASAYERKQMKYKSHMLYKTLAPIVQRRGMDMLKSDLKPKMEFAISVRLTPFQKYLYKRCIRRILAEKSGHLFKAVKRGSRVWNHPACLPMNLKESRAPSTSTVSMKMAYLRKSLLPANKAFQNNFEADEPDLCALDVTSCGMGVSELGILSEQMEKESGTAGSQTQAPSPVSSLQNDEFGLGNLFESRGVMCIDDIEDKEDVDDWWKQFPSFSPAASAPEGEGSIDMSSVSTVSELGDTELIGLGSKVLIFLSILSKSIEEGDKVVLFSQSLVTLDFLELILNSDWGEMLHTSIAAAGSNQYSLYTLGSIGGHLSRALKSRTNWQLGHHYERLDGSTPGSKRQDKIDKFSNSTSCPLFLISTMAGNMGINLQCANRVIIFDASWNPASDLQAIFRCYRYGQMKMVYVYRLLAAGTVEEKMYKKQITKMSVSARVVDAQMPDSHYTSKEMTAQFLHYQSDTEEEESDEDEECEVLEVDEHAQPVRKKITPYQRVARVVKRDLVLSATCNVFRDKIQRVVDMDPLLQDIEEEHLNEAEQQEAEKEFQNEVNRPDIPENYYAMMQAAVMMQRSGSSSTANAGIGQSSALQAGITIPSWMPKGYVPPGLREPSSASVGVSNGGNSSGSGLSSSSQPVGVTSTALNSTMVDYILKNFADNEQKREANRQQKSNAVQAPPSGLGDSSETPFLHPTPRVLESSADASLNNYIRNNLDENEDTE